MEENTTPKDTQDIQPKKKNGKKRWIALSVFAIFVIIAVVAILWYLNYQDTHISTDDAFVQGDIHMIAPKISETVVKILVRDNEQVKAGQLLVELDTEMLSQRLQEAETALQATRQRIPEIEAGLNVQQKKIQVAAATLAQVTAATGEREAALNAARADLDARQSQLKLAEIDLRRASNLVKKEVIPQSRFDRANTSFETGKAGVEAARAAVHQAEVALKAHRESIRQASAAMKAEEAAVAQIQSTLKTQQEVVRRQEVVVQLARLNLSYTKIYAPTDGYITRKSVQIGNQVQAGQPLMAVVPLSDVYIIANYKETEVSKINVGHSVEIEVDSYPNQVFHGKVDSIMAGTGAAFSLFPPENATGNYVKVVQRIPVKIVLDRDTDPEHKLRIGMSVVPTVVVE